MPLDLAQQRARRDQWFAATRERISEVVNPDGSGKIPQFNPPWREPVWILPALYTGPQASVGLANRMVERYNDPPANGADFNIFQSNLFAHCLHRFGGLLTPKAEAVMRHHVGLLVRRFCGSAQPDFKFHGANDNMPMLATCGLICGGEAVGDEAAVRHGVWNLHQARRLLSRAAWMSEFNSSTYSALTLTGAAKLATFPRDPAIRRLALDIEHRLWAEILLHYHPGTFMQAGPQCRAYPIDYAGHNHTLQAVLWMAFGPEAVGRDVLASYFQPDGTEVVHFNGHPFQSIAEYCHALDGDLHVPADLAELIHRRGYPAMLRGRSECMSRFDGMAAPYHTETYMEREFSLGTANGPLCGGEHTASLYATYQRKADPQSFRDAATLFLTYRTKRWALGEHARSEDGSCSGEVFVPSQGWAYAVQKRNVGLLLLTPNLKNAPVETDLLALALAFPAHYGRIRRSIIGEGPVRDGATGESAEVVPVSVEAGEVFIHIQPLLPTCLERKAALRFALENGRYETLELINYEGPKRAFARKELALAANGVVLTIVPRRASASTASQCAAAVPAASGSQRDAGGTCAAAVSAAFQGQRDAGGTCAAVSAATQGQRDAGGTCAAAVSAATQGQRDAGGTAEHGLEAFHRAMSDARITDYLYADHRFLHFERADVEFEVVLTPDPFGVQTEAIDGRQVERPVFESNQIDVSDLPFMSGEVGRAEPFFPWGDSLDVCWYPDLTWVIGSRGLPAEPPYSRRVAKAPK